MDREAIHQQIQIEQDLLRHVVDALRAAVNWSAVDEGVTRKISTVRFLAETLQRHTQRLWAIHEYDGYMSFIIQTAPEMTHTVEGLKREHEKFRQRVQQLVLRLEKTSDTNERSVSDAIDLTRKVLDEYETLNADELKLILDTFLRDTGGEG